MSDDLHSAARPAGPRAQGVASGDNSRIKRGVIGVLQEHGRLLVVQRAASVARAGCWCLPGGHLEPGENARRAVRREIEEELGLLVEPVRRVGAVTLADTGYVLAVWCVERRGGDLRPNTAEVAAARWLTPAEFRAVKPALPSNEWVLGLLGL